MESEQSRACQVSGQDTPSNPNHLLGGTANYTASVSTATDVEKEGGKNKHTKKKKRSTREGTRRGKRKGRLKNSTKEIQRNPRDTVL